MYYLELRTKKMVEKLELRHLAPYLPYKLTGLDINGDHSTLVRIDIRKFDAFEYATANKKFIPLLIHLNNINDQQWTEIFRVGFINVGHEVWPFGESFIERHANAIEIVYAGKSATYDFVNKQFETGIFAFNQKVAFEKIYEYHGDIDFLIEAGLALDKLDY